MRIGVPLQEPSGPDPMSGLREQVKSAEADGFAFYSLPNIFGHDAISALTVAGSPARRNQDRARHRGGHADTPPRHPFAIAQQALT